MPAWHRSTDQRPEPSTSHHGVMVRLRAGESFPVRELPRRLLVVAVRKKATTARASAGVHRTCKGSGSSHPPPPPPLSQMRPEGAAAAGNVTGEETDALDCGVCFLPLKPPIFQCNVGHVVCSACRDKLKATGKCHVCGINTGDYSRCYAMENIVESIRFPCPNAIHGCTARTTYYDQHFHCQTCPHRPCHCPREACGFLGSTAALLDHFNRAHGWPCTTKVKAATMNCKDDDDYEFKIQLHDGFNFLLADCATADSEQETIHGSLYLFLLNVVRQQHGCTITVLCIYPHHDEIGRGCGLSPLKEIQCKLSYSRHVYIKSRCGGDKLIKHHQESTFEVECTDLSNGLPNPDECFQFVVPKSVLAGGNTIEVGGQIVIIS